MNKKRNKSHHCLNCGYTFSTDGKHNNYCPNCGQENHDPRQPILQYLYELLENLFHFDGRSWVTLRLLLFSPGTVTRDHIHGIRQRYTPPARLFIFSLAVFIVFLEAAQDTMVKHEAHDMEKLSLREQMQQLPDTMRMAFTKPFFTGDKIYYSIKQLRELRETSHGQVGEWLQNNGMKSWLIYRLHARMVKHQIESPLTVRDYNRHIVRIHYQVLLLMMPVSAFLIYFFFFGRGRLFYDALVVSVHLYVFGLILGIIVAVAVLLLISLGTLKDTTIVLPLVMFISLIFNFIPAYKKVYGLSWTSTILRGMLIGFLNMSFQVLLFWTIAGLIG